LPATGIVAVQTSNVVQCVGGARRGEGTGQRGQQEAAAVHVGMVGPDEGEGQPADNGNGLVDLGPQPTSAARLTPSVGSPHRGAFPTLTKAGTILSPAESRRFAGFYRPDLDLIHDHPQELGGRHRQGGRSPAGLSSEALKLV
jgi:hypothetical protein